MNIFFKFLAAATVATMTIPAIAADDSSNDYISSNPFETMIRLGRISEKSPIYQMPAGSANGGYISSATTSGDAVIYPLGYAKPNSPGSYFAIVSKETSLLIAGETFEFNATMTVDPSNYTLSTYTDWNRDGVFEKESRPAQVAASTKSFVQTIAIPENAELGKTRIRIRIESTTPSSADASISGRVYDFVVYVLEASDRTDRFISVSSNNDELGTAIIETPALFAGVFRFKWNDETQYVSKIFLSMIPVGIVGIFFKDAVESVFGNGLLLVGIMLVVTALLLTFAHYARPRRKEKISYKDAFVIGLAQACAVLPGLSRSGTTIATGLMLGDKKEQVARFSFLMVIIPILGEAFLDLMKGGFSPAESGIPVQAMIVGFLAAFISGCVACKWMLRLVQNGKLVWFALYCVLMAAFCIGHALLA